MANELLNDMMEMRRERHQPIRVRTVIGIRWKGGQMRKAPDTYEEG